MQPQNYSNHRRYILLFHGVLFFTIVVTFIGSGVNLFASIGDHQRIYSASLITVLSSCVLMLFFFSRSFALRAQDRAIRAERNS